jgi:beta-phosphoglucomutase-like phosphatase (HAD superfamily)
MSHTNEFMKAVIFDMDGALTDSEPLINAAAVAMFRERGLVVQPEDLIPGGVGRLRPRSRP